MENKEYLTENDLLNLLNETLYAYVYQAKTKENEKRFTKNIKALIKTLKVVYKKKVVFDKKTLLYVFKN